MSDPDLDELAAELAEFAAPEAKGGRSSREERVIAGFEEIQRFYETHGRAPLHGEDRDEQLRDVRARRAEDRVLPRQEEQRGREQRQGRPGDSGADDRRAGPAVCEPVRTAQRGDPGDVQQTHPWSRALGGRAGR